MLLVGERCIKYSVDVPALEHIGVFNSDQLKGRFDLVRLPFLANYLGRLSDWLFFQLQVEYI